MFEGPSVAYILKVENSRSRIKMLKSFYRNSAENDPIYFE